MIDTAMGTILSLSLLDRRLGQLRERAIERALAGAPMAAEEVEDTVERALTEARAAFDRPKGGGPDGPGEGSKDLPPPVKLAQDAVLHSHERLMAIPFVGNPVFDDAD